MAYATIDKSNLTANLFSNLKTALETISDPVKGDGRKFRYYREPHVKGAVFDGYPYMLLDNYSITSEIETLNEYVVTFSGEFTVIVRAGEDDVAEFDELSDDVLQTFISLENENLGANKVSFISLDRNSKTTGIDAKEEFIIERTMQFSFRMQLDMSP